MPRTYSVKGSFVDEFITLVREEVDRRQMSMSDLAKNAECGRPYLYRVLSGEQKPTLEWAEKVASVLGIRLKFEKIS